MIRRTNSIPATRQAEIEAAYRALDAREIGNFGVGYLRDQTERYLRSGHAFACALKSDGEFLAMFRLNLTDIRATIGGALQARASNG